MISLSHTYTHLNKHAFILFWNQSVNNNRPSPLDNQKDEVNDNGSSVLWSLSSDQKELVNRIQARLRLALLDELMLENSMCPTLPTCTLYQPATTHSDPQV
jgi:hypothetical protein